MPKISTKELRKQLTDEMINYTSGLKVPVKVVNFYSSTDAGSAMYARSKVKLAKKLGIDLTNIDIKDMDLQTAKHEIQNYQISHNPDGITIQTPLNPANFGKVDELELINTIFPSNDIDGATDGNLGKLVIGQEPEFYPATPLAIMIILDDNKIELDGKNITVFGRSRTVGLPVASLLQQRDGTVTILHSKSNKMTKQMAVLRADVIVTATGHHSTIKEVEVGNSSVVIDAGISVDENDKTVGDLYIPSGSEPKFEYTSVPGGVGPVTTLMSFRNAVISHQRKVAAHSEYYKEK